MFNGQIGIRSNTGEAKITITRDEPIWCLAWCPKPEGKDDVLAVGCWDQTLSFYMLDGQQKGSKKLGYDPCTLGFFSNGEYLVIGGSNKKAELMTAEGVFLHTIAEQDSWVWTAPPRPNHNYVAVGSDHGNIAMYQLAFATVHGMYKDR